MGSSDLSASFFPLFSAVLLVFLNGFFVAAEFSLVKLRETKVRELAESCGWRGRLLAKVHANLDSHLSACQLGITLASLGLGWLGEPAVAALLEPAFHWAGLPERWIHPTSFAIAFGSISYAHIVLGELAPKTLALKIPDVLALWLAPPLAAFRFAMLPFIKLLDSSSCWLLRRVGLDEAHSDGAGYSTDEIRHIIAAGDAESGQIPEEWRPLAHALEFLDLEVEDLMRPFSDAQTLSCEAPVSEQIKIAAKARFSRYPCLRPDGSVSGVVHMKDVLATFVEGVLPETLEPFVRPIEAVSPKSPASSLLRSFKAGSSHFAVVGTLERPIGFLTMDNLLEALVGEIRDEFKKSQNDILRQEDGSVLAKGSVSLFALGRSIGLELGDDDRFCSISGMLCASGELPQEGRLFEFPQFSVVVKRMRGPKIVLVKAFQRREESAQLESGAN